MIIDIHGHRFEIFSLVSEIHDNVDLVMGMKNIFHEVPVSVFSVDLSHFPQ